MSHPDCLNCSTPLLGNYCSNCGQKANTHRLSVRHFFAHDVLHGIWHLDRGILFSLKGIVLRPGRTAKEYIAGRRAGHFNIITLLLLLSGLLFFVSSKQVYATHGSGNEIMLGPYNITEWVHVYAKYLLLSVIPLLAFCSYLLFRRHRYNYAEHLLLQCYYIAGVIVVYVVMGFFNWATGLQLNGYTDLIKALSLPVLLAVICWQLFRPDYKLAGWIWRFLALIALVLITGLVLLLIITLVVSLLNGGKAADFTIG